MCLVVGSVIFFFPKVKKVRVNAIQLTLTLTFDTWIATINNTQQWKKHRSVRHAINNQDKAQ